MATEHTNQSSGGAAGRHVVFWVGKRCMSMPINDVREVVDLQRVCPVPASPPSVLGIVSLRGTVLAVLDAERLLSGTAMSTHSAKVLVMVRDSAVIGGLAVHRIEGVMVVPTGELLRSHVANPSPFVIGYRDLRLADVVAVIDTDHLFSHIASLRFGVAERAATPLPGELQ